MKRFLIPGLAGIFLLYLMISVHAADLNIGGEAKMRYRQNYSPTGSAPGFSFYELELFIDTAINDYSSVYAEYNLMHSNKPDPEDVWLDFHYRSDHPAFKGGTGVKIGNFHYPFGWDNDDNEGFVYGGRTTVNVPLIRSGRIDGWVLRERQIGLQGNYHFDRGEGVGISTSVGVFNGNGSWLNYAGNDNDNKKDIAARVEATLQDFVFGASYLSAPATGGAAANVNNTAHVRDIVRTGVHFKYPNVAFPGEDMTLGGNRYLVWGEIITGENRAVTGAQTTQPTTGYYLEVDYAVNPSLLAFVRYDYYDQNTNVAEDHLIGITPGIRLPFLGSSTLILEAEYYAGGTAAPATAGDDRITLEVSTMF